MSKHFIITVDTEGEGGWSWRPGDTIKTENSLFIERFQNLCEKFNFPPVYLTNWEMANDKRFIEKAIQWEKEKKCEIGIHLHAWSNPPEYTLNRIHTGTDYLIEYPEDIMREKFKQLFELLSNKIGHQPYSHRAGRWAMDERYFQILEDFNIKVDCSVTPGISWKNNMGATTGGADYTYSDNSAHFIGNVLEVPMSVRFMRTWGKGSFKHKVKCFLTGKNVWLRPAGHNYRELLDLINKINTDNSSDYIELMIHSNELMPGGSPYFNTEEDIENLYTSLNLIFYHLKASGYTGSTLYNYYLDKI